MSDDYDPDCPTRRMNGHWLMFHGAKVSGCFCGFVANEEDNGYGDSVLRHFRAVVQQETLDDVHALVAKYRAVSPSVSQQCYLRDFEIALGMDLAPVTDRDGRTNW